MNDALNKDMQQGRHILEALETGSECRSVESKGRWSIISVLSQMGQHILPFLSSVVDSDLFLVSFLFLLFASQPSLLPVLMWQAWEMKNFMSGKGGPLLSLFSLANVDRKGKKKIKKNYCESVQWHRLPGLTNGQWKWVKSQQIFAPTAWTTAHLTLKHNCCFIFSLCSETGPSGVQMFSSEMTQSLYWVMAWSISDQISTDSTMGQEKRRKVWGAAERCAPAPVNKLSPSFHHVMWREWAQPRRSAFIPKHSWTPTREGRAVNLNMAKSLEPIRAGTSAAPTRLQLSLNPTGSYCLTCDVEH